MVKATENLAKLDTNLVNSGPEVAESIGHLTNFATNFSNLSGDLTKFRRKSPKSGLTLTRLTEFLAKILCP